MQICRIFWTGTVSFSALPLCICVIQTLTVRCRPPVIQSTFRNTALFVYLTLAVAFLSYARFCTLVIRDITNFLGIACFTVRKKDRSGEWVEAAAVNEKRM